MFMAEVHRGLISCVDPDILTEVIGPVRQLKVTGNK